jgi:hypothetical protein
MGYKNRRQRRAGIASCAATSGPPEMHLKIAAHWASIFQLPVAVSRPGHFALRAVWRWPPMDPAGWWRRTLRYLVPS